MKRVLIFFMVFTICFQIIIPLTNYDLGISYAENENKDKPVSSEEAPEEPDVQYGPIAKVLEIVTEIIESIQTLKEKIEEFPDKIVEWIMQAFLDFPLALAETMIDMILNPLAAAVPQFLLESIEIDSVPIVQIIWGANLKIGLVILVILASLGFGLGGNEAFKYENFGLPEHLWVRLFFTLGLMTASMQISACVYDVASWMTNFMFSQAAMAINTTWNPGTTEGMVKLVLFAIFLLPAVLLNICIYVIMIIRILDLMMMTSLSPLTASTFVLPNTSYIAKNHLKEYVAVTLVQFIIIVTLALWTGLATFMDGFMVKFTGSFAMEGVAQVVGQGIMMLALSVYTITRPGWLKRLLGVGSSSSIGALMSAVRMFI